MSETITLERIAELRKWSTFAMDNGEYEQLLDLAESALKQPQLTRRQAATLMGYIPIHQRRLTMPSEPQDRQCPVTPQELRAIANAMRATWNYYEAPMNVAILDELADWIEKPAPAPPTSALCVCGHPWERHGIGELGYGCKECRCGFFTTAQPAPASSEKIAALESEIATLRALIVDYLQKCKPPASWAEFDAAEAELRKAVQFDAARKETGE